MGVDKTLRLNDKFIDVEAEDTEFRDIRESARKTLRKEGVLAADQPLNVDGKPLRPTMPEMGLSSLTPEQVLDLLGQYGAFLEYVESFVADKKTIHVAREKTLKTVRAKIRTTTSGTTADKADAARLDAKFKAVERKEYEAYVLYEMADAALRGAYTAKESVSRAITWQGQDLERNRREHHVAPKRRGEFGAPKFKDKK